jgi:uncharacterized protein (TIGR00369 family)
MGQGWFCEDWIFGGIIVKLKQLIETAKLQDNYSAILDLIPYANFIGVSITQDQQGWLFTLASESSNVGNPISPALHGGVIAGFMEVAAALAQMLTSQDPTLPKIINFSIDYVRSAGVEPTYARCNIVRQGKRIANVTVLSWQTNKLEPIATARAHFLLGEET